MAYVRLLVTYKTFIKEVSKDKRSLNPGLFFLTKGYHMDHFKFIPKMANPSIIVSTAFNMNVKEWKLVYNTIKIVINKLSDKVGLPLIITLQDLMDNPHECTMKEHELIDQTDDDGGSYFICVHCLQKYAKADLSDEVKAHFFSKRKETNE